MLKQVQHDDHKFTMMAKVNARESQGVYLAISFSKGQASKGAAFS